MPTKASVVQGFFARFGMPAYATEAPEGAEPPYIVYAPADGAWGQVTSIPADVWLRTDSEAAANAKAAEVSKAVGLGGLLLACDGGAVWIRRGSPWCQAVECEPGLKRRRLNIDIEHATEY
ncbi:hypothetical protein [Gordonibacter pamelaeae]|uniref:hypothetical protein n=1 Tax=Gordonibacter pamelaeae TaxID=471189 RepID=UPI003A9436BB